jgi:ribose/xylose/arabinose/galactoside ABC-type transport system permease subunit
LASRLSSFLAVLALGQGAVILTGGLDLSALQMLLAGTTLPYATRAIIYGLVVLGAVLALRD